MYGPSETTTGGNALKFYSTQRLEVKRGSRLKDGETEYGYTMRVRVVKNKVAPPFRACDLEIIYGTGISLIGEIIDLAEEHDIIKKSGSWYSYNGNMIAQGREKLKKFLEDNPEFCNEVEAQVRTLLNEGAEADTEKPAAAPKGAVVDDFDGEMPDLGGIDPDVVDFD